jgi:DNA-binding NarL/FixJ family response regulator
MQVIMFDRQSIFIHGMKISLRENIPEIDICAVSQADELWRRLLENPEALLMLDGDMDKSFCSWLLQEKSQQFPLSRTVIVVSDYQQAWLKEALAWNVQAIVARHESVAMFAQAINGAACGLMCLPGEWSFSHEYEKRGLEQLSHRQREILERLANGESNKEISRALNISAGTVKAHLESLYRRLDVKNRTQAAMLFGHHDIPARDF